MAIEKVQRCAARWVTSNYDWRNSISTTSTLADLGWPTFSQCRQMYRLRMFYQTIYQLSAHHTLLKLTISLAATTHFILLIHSQAPIPINTASFLELFVNGTISPLTRLNYLV